MKRLSKRFDVAISFFLVLRYEVFQRGIGSKVLEQFLSLKDEIRRLRKELADERADHENNKDKYGSIVEQVEAEVQKWRDLAKEAESAVHQQEKEAQDMGTIVEELEVAAHVCLSCRHCHGAIAWSDLWARYSC